MGTDAIEIKSIELETAGLEALLGNRTRVVAFTHCSNVVATINPVRRWTDLVHQAGAWALIDGVSYCPHGLPDPGELGADIDEDADIEIGAADPGGLGDAEQAGFMQVALGLVGQPPQPLALLGPSGDLRHQAPRPLEHFVVADAGKGPPCLGQVRRGSPLEPSRTLTLHRALPSRTWP